jgi:hypothetical protein
MLDRVRPPMSCEMTGRTAVCVPLACTAACALTGPAVSDITVRAARFRADGPRGSRRTTREA